MAIPMQQPFSKAWSIKPIIMMGTRVPLPPPRKDPETGATLYPLMRGDRRIVWTSVPTSAEAT